MIAYLWVVAVFALGMIVGDCLSDDQRGSAGMGLGIILLIIVALIYLGVWLS